MRFGRPAASHAGFALPVTIVLAGVCALLIAAAYKMVNDGSRTVRIYLDQSCCRLAAQTAMDVFVEKLHAAFNEATWQDANGNESPVHMNDVSTIYAKFFRTGGMRTSLTSVAADFNRHEAVALSGTGTNATGWVARLGRGRGDVQTDIRIALLPPDVERDVDIGTDKGGFNTYAEVTLRMQATARVPRAAVWTGYGATAVVEQKIRFGALGFGRRAGHYSGDVYALPARCFESAVNADCPLVFGNCAGNSGWTINGEVRTRGFVYCGNAADFQDGLSEGGGKVTRIHGELHVATNLTGETASPYEGGSVVGTENFSCYAVQDGEMLRKCVNGDNCCLRFPSPGRRQGWPVPEEGSPMWYEYELSRKEGFSSGVLNGVFRGGYGVWQAVEAAGGAPVCHTGTDAEWFHIPILTNLKKGLWADTPGQIVFTGNRNNSAVILGRYPSRDPVTFLLPRDRRVNPNTVTSDPLYLIGTYQSPIQLTGPFYWNGDVIIGGFITGHGVICAGRNLHVVRDVVMVNPPTWRQDQDYDDLSRRENAKADMVTLMARGNIVVGNYLDATRNDSDNVASFRDKLQLVTSYDARGGKKTPDPQSLQLDKYRWRPKVILPNGSPIGDAGTEFDGNYFKSWKGRPILEPWLPTDTAGNSVTNLCRPVLRIDAMLCSVNAIVGVVGPGDFTWATADLEYQACKTADVVGYGTLASEDGIGVGLRAGHGMLLGNTKVRQLVDDYLMRPGVVFTLNGGLVCRDLAIYLDYGQSALLPGETVRWTPDRIRAIVNWDVRYMADSEDSNYLTRNVRDQFVTGLDDKKPVQNPLLLPTDASPKPQILSWREVSDGVLDANWQ